MVGWRSWPRGGRSGPAAERLGQATGLGEAWHVCVCVLACGVRRGGLGSGGGVGGVVVNLLLYTCKFCSEAQFGHNETLR